jgi:hypothetical protein
MSERRRIAAKQGLTPAVFYNKRSRIIDGLQEGDFAAANKALHDLRNGVAHIHAQRADRAAVAAMAHLCNVDPTDHLDTAWAVNAVSKALVLLAPLYGAVNPERAALLR